MSHLLTKNFTLALASDANAKEMRVLESIANPTSRESELTGPECEIKESRGTVDSHEGAARRRYHGDSAGARRKCRVFYRCDPKPNLPLEGPRMEIGWIPTCPIRQRAMLVPQNLPFGVNASTNCVLPLGRCGRPVVEDQTLRVSDRR